MNQTSLDSLHRIGVSWRAQGRYEEALSAFDVMHVNPSTFSLMGMAGLLAGVLHAPLTAVFMIAEVSGGYKLFVPIMITSALAYFFTKSMTLLSL